MCLCMYVCACMCVCTWVCAWVYHCNGQLKRSNVQDTYARVCVYVCVYVLEMQRYCYIAIFFAAIQFNTADLGYQICGL